MHLLLGYKVDHINIFILNLSVKGMAKRKPYCVRQAAPMTPEILLQNSKYFGFYKSWVSYILVSVFIYIFPVS